MKVTVCFGEVKVVVPCGNGDIYVRDLVQKAAGRFLKATQRESQVNVRTLKTSNGGILDPDDVVAEVADDRELIIADYAIEVDDNRGDGDTGPPSHNTWISDDLARKTAELEISESHVPKAQEHQGSLEWSVSVEETEGDSVKSESVCGEVGMPHQPIVSQQSNESSTSENSPMHTLYPLPLTSTGVPADLLDKSDSTVTSDLSRPAVVRRPPSVQSAESNQQQDIHDIVIENTGGPLGIHVMPHKDNTTGESGLLIHGIKQDGRLANNRMIGINDVIIEINGRSLLHASFNRAQEIFRDALLTEEICLKLRKSAVQGVFTALPAKVSAPKPQIAPVADQNSKTNANTSATKLTTDKKPQPTHDSKELHVELNKGPNGLGISLSVRDNLQGQKGIYIRNILPKGAAMMEGRLKTGDRLLRINSIDITQEKTTINEVMSILDHVKRGSAVRLLVCREGDGTTQPLLPRPLPTNDLRPGAPVDMENRHIKIFNIPLNDSGSAGLGISVKGKTATKGGVVSDLGIFIKAVITGGAASKDGRLWVNDQLLAVNNIALRDMSNKGAMEALRDAMLVDRPTPGHIKLTIARRNTPSIEDTDGAAAATVGGNVRGTVYKSDTDITIPQPLDKNNNNGEKADTVELSKSTDGRGSSYRPVPAPRKRPSIVSSSISQSSYDSKPDDAELVKTSQSSNLNALTCSTTETTPSEDKNIIVESVKTANFSPSLYLASFVHKDIVQTKDEVELNLTTNLGSRGRYEPIHPNHRSARPTVGQSKAVDNDSDSKAEDTDSVKHFDTNDTENQSDPAANVKVMEPLVWV